MARVRNLRTTFSQSSNSSGFPPAAVTWSPLQRHPSHQGAVVVTREAMPLDQRLIILGLRHCRPAHQTGPS